MIKLSFTEDELKELAMLTDLAVKAGGIDVVFAAANLATKINKAMEERVNDK